MTTTTKRLTKKKALGLTLASGKHEDRSNGLCVMEVLAWAAGEPHSDAPSCVCPVIRRVAIRINDAIPDAATRTKVLRPFLFRMMGTKGDTALEWRRAFKAVDLAVRHFAPLALESVERKDLADRLRAVTPIVDRETAKAAREETKAVRAAAAYAAADDAAYAAADAAYAADAAAYAAYAAADAAYAAADAAAYAAADAADAAAYAAAYAAYAAARAKFWEANGPLFLNALLEVK